MAINEDFKKDYISVRIGVQNYVALHFGNLCVSPCRLVDYKQCHIHQCCNEGVSDVEVHLQEPLPGGTRRTSSWEG